MKDKKDKNEPKNVKAGWGAFWIFVFVIGVYLLLDWLVLTPFINWIKG
ncbi:MAG: hypothetical protein IJE10_00015 [Clostridia bacterium]|nr:hypothetical protein [Clostridia bacterium]